MFDALKDIACFVTGFMSLLYGTRVAWVCGSKCQFSETTEHRAQMLVRSIPAAAAIFLFGFMILFHIFIDGFVTWAVFSVTSAALLSIILVSSAMPELKRMPEAISLIEVEMKDGSKRRMGKRELDVALDKGKVARFKRSEGWAVVGENRIRNMAGNSFYAGVDRRENVVPPNR